MSVSSTSAIVQDNVMSANEEHDQKVIPKGTQFVLKVPNMSLTLSHVVSS